MAQRDYPVGVAQQTVLDALGMTASGFGDASQKFDSLGIVVASKRQGRSSVPAVKILNRQGGGFNRYGEGETWQQYPDLTDEQREALSQFEQA